MGGLALFVLIGLATGPAQQDSLQKEAERIVVYDATRRFMISFPPEWKVFADWDIALGMYKGEPLADAFFIRDSFYIGVRSWPEPKLTTEQYAKQEKARLDELGMFKILATGQLRTGLGTAWTVVFDEGWKYELIAWLIKDGRLWMLRAGARREEYKSFIENEFQSVADSMKINVDPPKGGNVVNVRNTHRRVGD